MSKINAVRLINVSYNNNAIRISDECLEFNGESTLISLRNGGGKSVLVQMMTAPFVHRRYRDAKDRPFAGYFTTARPSFILVEWVLDGGAGYVLTGMMVRRNQEIRENGGDELDMLCLVSEYREPCLQDIHHLPVVEKGKKEITLKSFSSCRQLFESWKRDRSMEFFYYDMSNAAQSRQYFDKLKEYQIDYREWETIIKKINLKESGLSDLFADCRDEKGLVEKWFLEAVEGKLNREKNRIREFQSIVEKYTGQYKDNRSKIQRRDVIRRFKEETAPVREQAEAYRMAEEAQTARENRIACFIRTLEEMHRGREEQYAQVTEQISQVRAAILRTEYERISAEIHDLEKQKIYHVSNRDMIGMEQENLERERGQISRKLHIFRCARQQETVDEQRMDLEVIREKLDVSRKRNSDLEPERNSLGGKLKSHYQEAAMENRQILAGKEQEERENREKAGTEQEKLAAFSGELLDLAAKSGMLKARSGVYDGQEDTFNTRYKTELTRNILGEYEPGMLEIQKETWQRELEETGRRRLNLKKKLEQMREKRNRLERDQEDRRAERVRKQAALETQEKQKSSFEQELEERRVILKYLNLPESGLFDTERVLQESAKKLEETAQLKRALEKEEDVLQKEYAQLTQGKVLELPAQLEQEFSELGLHTVYGMEWLGKNGYPEEKNKALVKINPFLPYSLILSRREIGILEAQNGKVYTSSPVPIIEREKLELSMESSGSPVISFGESGKPPVSFYILFNENLLDGEKLAELVRNKEEQIRRKREAILIRDREYREYFARQEKIRNQQVTKENWQAVCQEIETLKAETGRMDEEIRRGSEELSELKSEQDAGEKELAGQEQEIRSQQRRMEDFDALCTGYEAYIKCREELERCRKQEEKIKNRQKIAEETLAKLRENLQTLALERSELEREQEEISRNVRKYERYQSAGEGKKLSVEETQRLEARYEAVTAGASRELKDLEEQEQRASGRYAKARAELEDLGRKYQLSPSEWKEISYNKKEESHQEVLLEDRNMQIERKRTLWNEEDKQIAVTDSRIRECRERMKQECGEDAPLPGEEIQNRDFEARKNQLKFEEENWQKEGKRLQEALRSCDENLTALAEFQDFPVREPVEWEEDPAQMTAERLRAAKGILVRDYNQSVRSRQEYRDRLTALLNRIVRMEIFQDEFYKKPLEAMLELTGEASLVLEQLDTTVRSYDSLMEKLEVDISLVEKEKERVVELLGEYVREVHENLGKIDHNSTITIRERPVKMLKIEIPAWEDNENLYQIRLRDMLDEVTQKGAAALERGENVQEYIGIQITTKNLYDTAIGIGNVQIRLYKIEEYREYPITWAEVAKNSGGEGFLSAFVILSSLLCYMRKDDTDIFAERNEGKVLLMDNPFAQTNASHLLKPLMDMARKTNTQLICLSGLGGESIYNRFDNIYVLNLIAASLRSGMQYLKAEHLRGNEPETVISSRIEVVEQQELIF